MESKPKILVSSRQMEMTLRRLTQQLIENHDDFSDTVILALQPRGIHFGRRLKAEIEKMTHVNQLKYGELDVTFYRDDFRRRENPISAFKTNLDFIIENKKVVLVDDVLFTGRTIRAGMDAMLSFGRPSSVELMVLIDRRFSRHLPIQPDYTGKTVDAISSEKVKVEWKDNDNIDRVTLYTIESTDT